MLIMLQCVYSNTIENYFLLKALEIAGELKDHIGKAVVCANLGSNYEMLGDITSALEYHQKVQCGLDNC